MYDVIKVLLFFGVFIGICAVAEWIAEYAPWIGYILIITLIIYGMARLYRRGWKNN